MKSPLVGYVTASTITDALAQSIVARIAPGTSGELMCNRHVLLVDPRNISAVAHSPDGSTMVLVCGRPLLDGKLLSLKATADALLAAFNHSGKSCLNALSNEFLAVIVDTARQQAYIQIDRIGRMRLNYAQLPEGSLCFSPDAYPVASIGGHTSALNAQSLYDYTFFHTVPSPQSIFTGVYKLPPAGELHWSPDSIRTAIYWRPQFVKKTSVPDSELRKEFLACLETSVRDTNPDASTASFLSGGIDSSTVTGLLAKIRGSAVPAYTIGFEQAGYDETAYASLVAKHFGADLRVHYITTRDVQDCIPELAALYDEPFGNSSAVPALMCARAARRDGITHLLAGDGGDELFAGNTRYAKQRIFETYSIIPAIMRTLLEKTFLSSSSLVSGTPLRKLASYIRQARIPLPDRLESYNFVLRESTTNIFEPDYLNTIDPSHPFRLMNDQYWSIHDTTTLNRMLYLDWKFTLADNDLRKVISTCNHAGVNVDFPWLDDRLIHFSTLVPEELKMRGTRLRFFVKQSLNNFLPEATLTKSKHGFGLPFGEWLKTSPDLQAQIYDLLIALGKRGVFQPRFITHLIAEHRHNHAAYYGTMVWVLALLEAWLQAHVKPDQNALTH